MEQTLLQNDDLAVVADPASGGIAQLVLYGQPLLAPADHACHELAINNLPFPVRSAVAERSAAADDAEPGQGLLYGERFVNYYTGFGLQISRQLRAYPHMQRLDIAYHLLRRSTPPTCPNPGPGGPPIEARAFIDTITLPCWQWQFWGDDTRMLHLSLHCSGPDGEFGHVGYNRGRVPDVKQTMQNIWRRQYPGVMAVHGAVYYNDTTGHWLAFTCRRPQVGYYLDLDRAGLGLSYSFTLHDELGMNQSLQLPEVTLHYGRTTGEMEQFVKAYTTQQWQPLPDWISRTTWFTQELWEPHKDWTQFWDRASRLIDAEVCSGLGPYLMIHHWSRAGGGTKPYGYEPDPTMGSRADFERGARAMQARGVPLGVWMSHSGLAPGRDIDEDWFVRGVDGGWMASWGDRNRPALVAVNPGHPGYIAYTKRWMQYYLELGFRWFFFDCGGWAMAPDYRPRDFMRFPGDTGLMAVRFYEAIVPFAQAIDPGVVISGEGFSSDFPIHVCAIRNNPVHAPDGLGPRDYMLSWNRLPGKRVAIDQAGALVPASGVCRLPGPTVVPGQSWDDAIEAMARNDLFKKVTRFVREHGTAQGLHLRGDISIIDDHVFFPAHHDGAPVRLPEAYSRFAKLVNVVDGRQLTRAADGAFTVTGMGMYELQR